MDNQFENVVNDSAHAMTQVAETAQAHAQQTGEHTFAAARDIGDTFRAMVEKSVHDSRARYAKSKAKMSEATAALETSLGAARDGVSQFNAKAIETIKSDAQAQFDLLTAMFSAKSLPELATINTEFMRKRFETATARAKTFSEFARKVADETAAPLRERASKTFKFGS